VPFYQRDGFVPARNLIREGGSEQIYLLKKATSRWWCVDGKLGMVFSGGIPEVAGVRKLGANWARTESYLDRMDVLTSSPLRVKFLSKNQELISMAAGVYPSASSADVKRFSSAWKDLTSSFKNRDWMGVVAEMGNGGYGLAVANLGKTSDKSTFFLSWKGWAPVLTDNCTFSGSQADLTLFLSGYETYRDTSYLLLRSKEGVLIRVRRIGYLAYELTPLNIGRTMIEMRWLGPQLERITLTNSEGAYWSQQLNTNSANACKFLLTGKSLLKLESNNLRDTIPPFIEVKNPVTDQNGEIKISVVTNDRSGVAAVYLYRDGELVGTKNKPPFEWRFKPAKRMHCFTAKAIDSTAFSNTRTSHPVVWTKKDHEVGLVTNINKHWVSR
jgi:hypothetical protein